MSFETFEEAEYRRKVTAENEAAEWKAIAERLAEVLRGTGDGMVDPTGDYRIECRDCGSLGETRHTKPEPHAGHCKYGRRLEALTAYNEKAGKS